MKIQSHFNNWVKGMWLEGGTVEVGVLIYPCVC